MRRDLKQRAARMVAEEARYLYAKAELERAERELAAQIELIAKLQEAGRDATAVIRVMKELMARVGRLSVAVEQARVSFEDATG